ncbi:MAG: N-acyl-D-amino-acid deacylase family protein [Promethearchaeota archaeon]
MNILIKNGMITDGTGASKYKSDLLIKNDKIAKIGNNLEGTDCKIIDASNKIVAPGFIDMHSHGDLSILKVNKAEPTMMQGVTTLVVGMCGLGLAPANKKVRQYYSGLVANMLGSSELQLYDTIQDYMRVLEKKGVSTNLAFFIPQGNVRTSILGIENRLASPEELDAMKNIVRRGMEAGAFGLSTGLIYPPGSITPTEELIELCKVVKEYKGIYDSHMRNEGTGVVDIGMRELIKIANSAKIQAHISHWKAGSNFAWKLTPDMINLVKKAREDGLNINADIYPYEESSTSLSGMLLRPWVYKNFQENLTKTETRKRIINETFELLFSNFSSELPLFMKIIPKFIIKKIILATLKKKIRIISVIRDHQIEGKFLGEILNTHYPKKKPLEALLDLIRDEEGGIMITFKQMSEKKSILELIKQDFTCIGSDGFLIVEGNTHPRSYGTFPKILGNYVRKKNLFSLEEGIRKMTGLTASILGLKDRGLLKQGYKADIVIFDPEKIQDKSSYENGRQYPEGIDHVIVNGQITVSSGKHLGIFNGEILKHFENI